jgi:glucose-1-phosphate cytidylyltransferase
MKVVLLAGGFGTRISEESHLRPKPMIEIGEKPILWHIMKIYSHYGFNEFIICLGYKAYAIKEFFADYYLHTSDVTFDLSKNEMTVHNNYSEPWKVTLVDTGLNTMTGGRIKRVKDYIGDEPFMLTYGDGVSNVNIKELLDFHEKHGKIATITAIHLGGRFGVIDVDKNNSIFGFAEKSKEAGGLINGGFMVMNPEIFDYIDGDKTVFEKEPLENLALKGELKAYKHDGFWQCMDTQRDKHLLEDLWSKEEAPWHIW